MFSGSTVKRVCLVVRFLNEVHHYYWKLSTSFKCLNIEFEFNKIKIKSSLCRCSMRWLFSVSPFKRKINYLIYCITLWLVSCVGQGFAIQLNKNSFGVSPKLPLSIPLLNPNQTLGRFSRANSDLCFQENICDKRMLIFYKRFRS